METWDLNYHGTLTFARLWKINGRPNASVLANVLQDLEEQKDMDMEDLMRSTKVVEGSGCKPLRYPIRATGAE